MKVGDLVRLVCPRDDPSIDIGIVLDIRTDSWGGQVNIEWFGKYEHSGLYPIDDELLELISESR